MAGYTFRPRNTLGPDDPTNTESYLFVWKRMLRLIVTCTSPWSFYDLIMTLT